MFPLNFRSGKEGLPIWLEFTVRKKRDGEGGRKGERERGRRCEYKSMEKESNLLSHYLPKPVT